MEIAKPTADRNLLVGILALQLDFVNRDQLVAAMNAWLLDKTRPLEQILVETAALSDEEKVLLSALVAKHLQKHHNDPQASLAAVSSVAPSVCEQLHGLKDTDVEASLSRVASARPHDSELTASFVPGGAAMRGQRYRVLRPHAKGGLGEVFVASDEELPREVALKQILQDHADNPDSRARFVLEAELTGGLEHPGIVPVYGLGQYADGRPFYAMRFIKGDSLKEAIRDFHKPENSKLSAGERSMQLRKLLGRFIDVCDAIEYAHSRGVLHRDLKPGNVMLGKYGETLVVDWGLAKTMGRPEMAPGDEPMVKPASVSGSAPTQMGSAIGTPAYMSPEQAAGRLDLLGPASDVYSLGATLFSLLTGQPPVKDDDATSILRKVQRGEIARPRQLNSSIPVPLEAICLKAMALAPADRYASPRALAEDVEHWLADEPVSAHRDSLLARSARWARRHKVAVAAIAVLLVTAVVSLSIGAALLAGANRRILAAQLLAEENERAAKENFRLTRKAVNDYFTNVSQEALLDEPGMQPLRRKLLTDALSYYQEFVRQRSDDPQLQVELRDAHFRVGVISAKIGMHKEALSAFRKALEMSERLLEQDAQDITLRVNHALCLSAIAGLSSEAGRSEDVLADCERAVQVLQGILKELPQNSVVLHELLGTYNQIAVVKNRQGKLKEAADIHRRILELGNPLAAVNDATGEYRNTLAQAHHNLGALHREFGDHTQAIEHLLGAIKIREELTKQFPRSQSFRSKLALSYGSLAGAYSDLGRAREAVERQLKAIEIREQLAQQNPAVTDYHDQLAGSYSNLASEYRLLKDLQAAEDFAVKAAATWQRLSEQQPEVVRYRRSLGTSFYNLGNLFLGDPATDTIARDEKIMPKQAGKAIEYYLKGIKIYEALVQEFPDVPDYQSSLGSLCNNCGSAYSLLKNDVESGRMNARGLALREQLVAKNPDVPDYRNQLASTYANAAGYETDRKKIFELLGKAVKLRQSLVDDFPKVPEYRYKLAFSLQVVALQQFLGGARADAMASFPKIIEITEQLESEFPDQRRYRDLLVQALELQAAGQRLTGAWKEAATTEQKRVAIFERLSARDPKNLGFQVSLARAIHDIGKCFDKGKDIAAAFDHYTRAINLLQPLAKQNVKGATAMLVTALEFRVNAAEKLKRYDVALADLTQLEPHSKDPLKSRLQRARLRSLTGGHAEAAKAAAELLAGDNKLAKGQLYDTACVFGLAYAAAKADKQLDEERRKVVFADYTRQAVAALRKAREAGYFATAREIEHLSKDNDFDAIRNAPAFIEFSRQIREQRN